MNKCDICGNQYDKCLEITQLGKKHIFDCFECAIHALAPVCSHCKCRIIGHGMEVNNKFYCCAHCAHKEGVAAMKDRI